MYHFTCNFSIYFDVVVVKLRIAGNTMFFQDLSICSMYLCSEKRDNLIISTITTFIKMTFKLTCGWVIYRVLRVDFSNDKTRFLIIEIFHFSTQ